MWLEEKKRRELHSISIRLAACIAISTRPLQAADRVFRGVMAEAKRSFLDFLDQARRGASIFSRHAIVCSAFLLAPRRRCCCLLA